ncbi:hypothetical protein LTR84_005264 [Exophiala bonariae]|uniref:RING-type domain-containing protein n=1 Tax=Exophiala bonariae TaxID=1690606 RepID=A0AAV9NPR9_9EURO|nr:hypothetical protein LTR84_005264 [Exophiala bonariae]
MASSQNSPVLVQHASPPHTLSPTMPVVSISAFEPPPLPESMFSPTRTIPPFDQDTATVSVQEADTEMANTQAPIPVPVQEPSPVVETPPPPREELTSIPEPEAATIDHLAEDPTTHTQQPSPEQDGLPPTPPAAAEPGPEVPEWATWEDDNSTPNEEEMTQINARDFELSALDVPSVEKRIYYDVDDPDQRPIKKLRLSWVIKNLRGTRNKPNPSRVMISPPAEVDGNYWQIKLYPRGNKCSSLSAYIRCTPVPPKLEPDTTDSTFAFYEGAPEADLGNDAVPTQTLTIEATSKPEIKITPAQSPDGQEPQKQESSQEGTQESSQETDSQDSEAVTTDNTSSTDALKQDKPVDLTWRVAAQLGMIMYNPAEPRTCTYMSSEHQFSCANDDWGWTNFHGSWREIHRRQHAQRTALLQNDTIAIDAYIRIFDDPTQALWWHSSESEAQWDSKALAGYFPMGTPPLYHSPAVAGITAWLLLAPFRKALQAADAGEWRIKSQSRPRPLLEHLQKIIFLMKWLDKASEPYVDLNDAIVHLTRSGESFTDVMTFWEVLRRGMELELADDSNFMQAMAKIFDSSKGPICIPPLPVEGVSDIQQGLDKVLPAANIKSRLPDLLSLPLAREKFDKKTREWKLMYDRIMLNDQVMALDQSEEGSRASYTLYGFMVQVGERNSGKFYTVLRPNGPGTKWLAFEDGDGNKIFSYTRKRINEYEGLEGQALKDLTSTRQTAYLAMYIRTSCVSEYLTGTLEEFKLPQWMKTSDFTYVPADGQFTEPTVAEKTDQVRVECYSDDCLRGREGLLDTTKIRTQAEHKGQYQCLVVPNTTTYQEIRAQLSRKLNIKDPSLIQLFKLRHKDAREHTWGSPAQLKPVKPRKLISSGLLEGQSLCLWYFETTEDVDRWGDSVDSRIVTETADIDHEPLGGNAVPFEPVAEPEEPTQPVMAAPDAEQASVQEAVVADLVRAAVVHETVPLPSEDTGEGVDTTMHTLEDTTVTAEDNMLGAVPHGHLVDAANHDTDPAAPSTLMAEEPTESPENPAPLTSAEEQIVAAIVTQDAEMMDFTMQNTVEEEVPQHPPEYESSDSSESESSISAGSYIYGIIQVLDLDKQNFSVFGTFFAKTDANIKDFLRTRMGYIAADKDFNVWRRISEVGGRKIGADKTFSREKGIDHGANFIVGEVLSEAELKEYEQQGKFTDPWTLSTYLRMVERKHPVKSLTTDDAVEVAVFGADYFKGPLVNGRGHGQKCLCITGTGNVYEGPLVCDKKSGKGGKMTYQNGDTYEGEWEADERHGQGTFIENRTGNKYVGGFEYGKRWGMGTTYWQVADEQADLCQICYGEEIDALFFDCGHVCACVECARQCDICPICRKSVKQVVKMFRA